MGLLRFIKSQLIDIIEWLDETNYTLVHRFPHENHEVKNGAKLICRENQAAILINEGTVADIFGPGTHTLSTQNMPVLSTLKGWKYGFQSPFKVDVYFVNLRQYVNEKWGTPNPFIINDPTFGGRVRIRAFGTYNFKIIDPKVFFSQIVGTQGLTTTTEITDFIRRILVSRFQAAAGQSQHSVAEMAMNNMSLADAVKGKVAEAIAAYGVQLTSLIIENITVPKEIEKALDDAAVQAVRGVNPETLAWESVQAMRDVARNPNQGGAGNMMGAGMGMGMGMGVGNMMGNMMGGMMPGHPQQQGYPPQPGYPPQQGYPPQGHPGQQGYPPQGYQQGHPQQGQAPQGAPPAPQGPAPNSLEAKLMKLKSAFEAELLTEEEYKAKRAQLLADF